MFEQREAQRLQAKEEKVLAREAAKEERLARKAAEKAAKTAAAQLRKAQAQETRKCVRRLSPCRAEPWAWLSMHRSQCNSDGQLQGEAAAAEALQKISALRITVTQGLFPCTADVRPPCRRREKEVRQMADGALRTGGRIAPRAKDDEDIEAELLLQEQRAAGCVLMGSCLSVAPQISIPLCCRSSAQPGEPRM